MKKVGFLQVILIFLSMPLWACDVCGCASSMGTGSFGINNRVNLISLRSQYAGFYAYDHMGLRANDQYMQAEIYGQYNFLKRFQLKVDVPYGFRFREYLDASRQLSGVGDPWARLDFYPLAIQADEKRKSSHELAVGMGIKAPLGQFQPERSLDGLTPLPANFQLGTGSWDKLFSISYRWQRNKWGIQAQANSRINGANQRQYEFGNQTSAQLIGYRWVEQKQHSFRLLGGAYAEHIQEDRQFSAKRPGTGGKGLFATAGAEYVQKKYAVNLQMTQPLFQNYASNGVETRTRLGASVSYFFN